MSAKCQDIRVNNENCIVLDVQVSELLHCGRSFGCGGDLRVTQALVVSVDRGSDVIASAGVHSTLQPRP